MNNMTNMMIDLYIAESTALRIEKLEMLKGNAELYKDMLDLLVFDSAARIRKAGLDAIFSTISGAEACDLTAALEKLTMVPGINVKDARRRIADKLIEDNQYKF